MELSGLIFVALALVWAVVLIPKALRHHDEVARTRSVADLSDDVRVVSRRAGAEPVTAAARPPRTAAARAAARRRRILTVLVVADIAVGAGALTGLLLRWAPAVPVLLTVAFLVVARVTVRRERARRQRELQRRRRTALLGADQVPPQRGTSAVAPRSPKADAPVVEPASGAVRVETTVPDERNEQGLNVVSGLDDTSSIPVVRAGDDGPGSLWDPLPVTLPTYVSKPRASRSVRTIDLSAPDVSSSGRDSAASALVAEAATAAVTATPASADDEAARAVGS